MATYNEAVKNLESGGLQGQDLTNAKTSLQRVYNTPVGTLTVEPKGSIQNLTTNVQPVTSTAPTVDSGLYARTGITPFETPYSTDVKTQTANVDQIGQDVVNATGMSSEEEAASKRLAGLSSDYVAASESNRKTNEDIYNSKGLTREQAGAFVEESDRQSSRKLADLSVQRLAASNELAALTGVRTSKLDALKTKLGLEDKRLETLLGLEDKFRTFSKEQRAESRQTISDILDASKGQSFEELDPETQQSIINAAANSPLTLGNIKQALNRNKVAYQEERQKNALSIQAQRAQIASTNALATQRTNSAKGGTGGVSQELQDAINNGTIDPNRINSRTLSLYNDIAKAGVDAVGAHAGAAGETKAITDLSTYKSTAVRTLGVLEKNLPLVENLADKVNQTGVPGLDSYISGVKAYAGNDTNVIKYVNSLKTLRAEYAQMLAKGSATTESDKHEAAQAIPAGLSSAGYAALGEQLRLEASNILQASDDAIKAAKSKGASNTGVTTQTPKLLQPAEIPSGYYQASDGLLYKK